MKGLVGASGVKLNSLDFFVSNKIPQKLPKSFKKSTIKMTTSRYGLYIFQLYQDPPVGTGVCFDEPLETAQGKCMRKGCENDASEILDLPTSTCSPFGSNIAFLYEDRNNRTTVQLDVCEECKTPQIGNIYQIGDELVSSTLSRHTFSPLR